MKSQLKLGLVAAFVALASFAFAGSAGKSERCKPAPSVRISATIYGHLDYEFEGRGAWVGYAVVQFGNQPAKVAKFVDRNTGMQPGANGAFSGTETLSLAFLDGSGSFDILGVFDALPAATPGLYQLLETGTLANGTVDYARTAGSVVVKGPFLHPDPSLNPATLVEPPLSFSPWIAELRGRVTGLATSE
jgi:hypothetical protein